jgi:hypothetical protein
MKLRTLVLHVAAGITLGLTAAPAISQGYQAEVTKQRLCNHMGLTAQRAYLMKSKGLPKETDFGTPSHIDPLSYRLRLRAGARRQGRPRRRLGQVHGQPGPPDPRLQSRVAERTDSITTKEGKPR